MYACMEIYKIRCKQQTVHRIYPFFLHILHMCWVVCAMCPYIWHYPFFFFGIVGGNIYIKILLACMFSFASAYNYFKLCNNYSYIFDHFFCIYIKIFLELLVSCISPSLSSLFTITISHRSKPFEDKLHLMMV